MCLTVYSMMTPLKYYAFEIIMENGAFTPFSIVFSKVLKKIAKFFSLIFFNVV